MTEIGAHVNKMFFDQKAVQEAVGRARLKVLRKAGYIVQQSAKSLLVFRPLVRKPRKVKDRSVNRQRLLAYYAAKKASASQPGRVPFVRRKRYPNLSSVIYSYDPSTTGVVVGPIERRQRSMQRPAPDVQEHGGQVVINVKTKRGIKPMRATYPKRPLMGPAFKAAASKLPETLQNVIGPS